jgi:replicative DNA helicase
MSTNQRMANGRWQMADGEGMKRTRRREPGPKDGGDRLPPYSAEAEQGVLGCILEAPLGGRAEAAGERLDECEEAGLVEGWFYDLRHQRIWKVMRDLHQAGTGVDVITVQARLKDGGELEECGGIAFLLELQGNAPVGSMLSYYLEIVREKWELRQVVRTGTEMVAGVYSVEDGEATTARALIARATRDILRLQEESAEVGESVLKEVLVSVLADLEDYHRGGAQMRGIGTGLEYLDKLLCGLGGKHGNYIVLSGRPGMGKTSLMMQILEFAALDYVWWDPVLEIGSDGKLKPAVDVVDGVERIRCERRVGVPVGVFTLEMAKEALAERILFSRARGDLQRWRTGFATNADMPPLGTAAGALATAKFYIDDVGRATMDGVRAKARRMTRQYGIKLWGLDYVQLLRSGGKRFREDRVQELAEISGEIQLLGKELRAPWMVAAQMNRDYEKDPNRAPRLSDLKDCGSIEQDADVVGLLYKPKLREKQEEEWDEARKNVFGDDWSKAPVRVDLMIAKNRHGPDGGVQLVFQKSCTRFTDYVSWLKEKGLRASAAGERASHTAELPTNEEMELGGGE